MSDTHTREYSNQYRWYVVILLMCVYACNYADRALLSVLVEPIKAEFGVSDTMMGFLGGTLFAGTYALCTVPLGWLGDRVNRRNLLTICLAGWSLMTAVSGLARNFIQLATAQVLVAAFESGSPPAMNSLISDLFSRAKRGFATAVWFSGVSIGMFIGYTLGGILANTYGWRTTFIALGLPGLLLAFLIKFTVSETPRGMADGNTQAERTAPDIHETLRFFRTQKALRHALFGMCLVGLTAMGPIYWLTAFFIRSHDVSLAQAGVVIGLILGITGVLGGPIGGFLMDHLGRRDQRWHAWLICVLLLASIGPMILLYMSPNLVTAYSACVIWSLITAAIPVTNIAMLSNLAAAQFRGLTIAVSFLLMNLVGYGLGSQLVGISSDWIDHNFGLGRDSLRYACVVMSIFSFWAIAHYLIVARHIREGYKTAEKWETS